MESTKKKKKRSKKHTADDKPQTEGDSTLIDIAAGADEDIPSVETKETAVREKSPKPNETGC